MKWKSVICREYEVPKIQEDALLWDKHGLKEKNDV
jgi:hypothetical protein